LTDKTIFDANPEYRRVGKLPICLTKDSLVRLVDQAIVVIRHRQRGVRFGHLLILAFYKLQGKIHRCVPHHLFPAVHHPEFRRRAVYKNLFNPLTVS
jgi:hypothetical protein